MKTIALITQSFPFHGGEQFLEAEVRLWGFQDVRLVVIPAAGQGQQRPVPGNVAVEPPIASRAGRTQSLSDLLRAAVSSHFWRDAAYLVRAGRLTWGRLKATGGETARALSVCRALARAHRRWGHIDVAYSYWNDALSYGAVICKRRQPAAIGQVVSRAHRFEVDEERHPQEYLPLKRQFISDVDRLYAVSNHGRDQICTTFGASPRKVEVSRLGVPLPTARTEASDAGRLSLVSLSFCTAVKRLDRLISAIARLGAERSDLQVSWVHVGDGPLLDQLRGQAWADLQLRPNVAYSFKGRLENSAVVPFLLSQQIDVIVNVSEIEGIPVSLMEAMSCGIPAMGPNVGGMAELVAAGSGALLPADPSAEQIAAALTDFLPRSKDPAVRNAARQHIADNFNADVNYRSFILGLLGRPNQTPSGTRCGHGDDC